MNRKFPRDAPRARVLAALRGLGFEVVREGPHTALVRQNQDGTTTPMTMPRHAKLKASTLRRMCTEAGIPREQFLEAYDEA